MVDTEPFIKKIEINGITREFLCDNEKLEGYKVKNIGGKNYITSVYSCDILQEDGGNIKEDSVEYFSSSKKWPI